MHGNPYDGHTLQDAMDQVKSLLPEPLKVEHVYVDRGYKGARLKDDKIKINIAGTKREKRNASLKKWLKRRSAIEPIIGHIKNDGGTRRNYLLAEKETAYMLFCLAQVLISVSCCGFFLGFFIGSSLGQILASK